MGILPMPFPSTRVCRITRIALAFPSHRSRTLIGKSFQKGKPRVTPPPVATWTSPLPMSHFTFGAPAAPQAKTLEWRLEPLSGK